MSHWHDALGIKPEATLEEIKSAYRKRALECHPDVCKEADAAERFKRITEAYHVLTDPTYKPQRPSPQPPPRRQKPQKPPRRPRSPYEGFVISDAPPPKRDIWGNPIDQKSGFKDSMAGQYGYETPVPRVPYRPYRKAPEIDLWKQMSPQDTFWTRYWREYDRLRAAMVYEEPEKFWAAMDAWSRENMPN